MSGNLELQLQEALESRKARSILRQVNAPHGLASQAGTTTSPSLVDFSSNDYLSLTQNTQMRSHFLESLGRERDILGSRGSRLLDGNTPGHFELETRLQEFFGARAALLFNSGFEANVGIFSCLPQPGDAIVADEYIHASVWDGCRSSRVSNSIHLFKHNSTESLEVTLRTLTEGDVSIRSGVRNVFVAIESLYSMDGDFAPISAVVEVTKRLLPLGNGYIIVDEAHTTGVYGPEGKGLVAMLGLESDVAVRLHTFGKALGSNGAVVLCSPVVRSYLCNYARPLVFSTAMSCSAVVQIGCAFDMLESGVTEKLAAHLFSLAKYFVSQLAPHLVDLPARIASVPAHSITIQHKETVASPIVPILTARPRALAEFLQGCGYLARPITYPTVPKGQDRVRICVHAGNTFGEVDGLISSIVAWIRREEASPGVTQIAHSKL